MFETWLSGAETYFNKIVIGIVILFVGLGLGILTKKFFFKLFQEIELNKIISRWCFIRNLEDFLSTFLSYLIYFATIIFFLQQLEILSVVIYSILGIILLLLLLTFLVGIKDILPNLIGRLKIRTAQIKVGQNIVFNEIAGKIVKIGIIEIEIKTSRGDILHVPNALFRK